MAICISIIYDYLIFSLLIVCAGLASQSCSFEMAEMLNKNTFNLTISLVDCRSRNAKDSFFFKETLENLFIFPRKLWKFLLPWQCRTSGAGI